MTPEKQKMIAELKRLMVASDLPDTLVRNNARVILREFAVTSIPALLEEVEKGWEQGVKDAAKAAMKANPGCTIAAILALLPLAPDSDDARKDKYKQK